MAQPRESAGKEKEANGGEEGKEGAPVQPPSSAPKDPQMVDQPEKPPAEQQATDLRKPKTESAAKEVEGAGGVGAAGADE